MNETIIRPGRLYPGDCVALVATSSKFSKPTFFKALRHFRETGFLPVHRNDLFKVDGPFAGSDQERIDRFNIDAADEKLPALLFVRGGYGLSRIIDRLDLPALVRNRKAIIGFSDITVLHLLLAQHYKMISFHGPMLHSGFAVRKQDNIEIFKRWFFERNCSKIPGSPRTRWWRKDRCQGRLIGGNLTMIVHSLRTPFEIETAGRILFIEDVGEPWYKIDRYLLQLKLSGKLDRIVGLIVGEFLDQENLLGNSALKRSILEKIPVDIPVLSGFPISHGDDNRIIPHFALAELDPAYRGILIVEECFE